MIRQLIAHLYRFRRLRQDHRRGTVEPSRTAIGSQTQPSSTLSAARRPVLPALSLVLAAFVATACSDAPTGQPAPASRATGNGASGDPSTLQWNSQALSLAAKYLLRPTPANRAYMLLSVAEARALTALANDVGTGGDADNGMSSHQAADRKSVV